MGGKKLLPAKEASTQYATALRNKDVLSRDIDKKKPEIDKMMFAIPPEQLAPQLVRQLQQFAKDSGIHLREIKPLRTRRTGAVTRVPLTVRFSTTDFNKSFVGFVYRIEDPAGKLVVEKFSVTALDPKTRILDVEVQVSGFTKETTAVKDNGRTSDGA